MKGKERNKTNEAIYDDGSRTMNKSIDEQLADFVKAGQPRTPPSTSVGTSQIHPTITSSQQQGMEDPFLGAVSFATMTVHVVTRLLSRRR
ncbi:hypothetical protein AB0J82_39210 [Asanoa sp. NPDC049518]|uniref:hypothetical protein n=1 Tax=unclassified Asanoa TaxID=2685164 RepID=UPI0034173B6A